MPLARSVSVVSTTVLLLVTPRQPVDPEQGVDEVPADVAALLNEVAQPLGHGLARQGSGPWRLSFQLSGVDRVDVGRQLQRQLKALGYEVDLRVSR